MSRWTDVGFTTSATLSAGDVAPGGSITITAHVTSDTATAMQVNAYVVDPTQVRLVFYTFGFQAFSAGVERTFAFTWPVPGGAATGGHTVAVALVVPGYAQPLHWNDNAAFFTVNLAGMPSGSTPKRIMPLGDSLTDGNTTEGGYRIALAASLTAAGHSFDFVGSRYNGLATLSDKEHEGHPRRRIEEITEAAPAWLTAYKPHVVLVLLGTNDMAQNFGVSTAPTRLITLLSLILATLPTAKVVVSSIPRATDAAILARIQAYNAALPAVVAGMGGAATFVDGYAAIATSDLVADGVHLTSAGYDKLAAAWYPTVHAVLNGL